MISTRLIAVAFVALSMVVDSAVAQDYPTTPPPAGPVRPMPFPPFREFRLPNGLQVVLVESAKQPVLSLSLSIPAGTVHDPADREGLAELTATLLTKGAGQRSAEAFAEAIERVGGTLNATADNDFLTVSAFVLSPHAGLAFELLADAVMRPAFPESEVELLRTQTLSGLQLEQTQPAAIAARMMARELYGSHPYSRRPSPASVRAITRDEVAAFATDRLRPEGALLVIAGHLSEPEARRLATAAFSDWRGAPPVSPSPPPAPTRRATDILLVHRPGSVQADLRIGNLTYLPTSPQQYAARVANQVLGGGADSRLFMILREERSWTYGAYASLTRPRGVGSFIANSEVRTEVADSALREMLHQIRRVTSEPIPAEEFGAAQGGLVGRFPLQVETVQQVAAQVASVKRLGLPDDYLATFRTRLAAVTPTQALEAARHTMHPDAAVIVVVGDARALYDRMAAIAPVRLVRVDGTPLDRTELTTVATGPRLDPSRLVATRDSFAIQIQGNTLGHQVSALAQMEEGFEYTEAVQIATFVQQNTTLRFDRDGRLLSLVQHGQLQGAESSSELTVRDGRISGQVTVPPTPMGPGRSVTVDTVFAAGTMVSEMLGALIPALPWADGASWNMPVFTPSEGTTGTVEITVAGTESVTVPAGTFEVYRVDMTSDGTAMTLFVTREAPHTLVKIAPAGQPVEFVLVARGGE